MPEAAGFEGVSSRSELQEHSVSGSSSFWAAVARHRLSWISPFTTVQDCDLSRGRIKWFEGGKLNVSGEIPFHQIITRFCRKWPCGCSGCRAYFYFPLNSQCPMIKFKVNHHVKPDVVKLHSSPRQHGAFKAQCSGVMARTTKEQCT